MFRTLRNVDWFTPDRFAIRIERREPQETFPPHKHEFSEIVIVTGGKGLHVVGGESWPVAAGDVFVVGAGRGHEYRDLDRLKLINVLFQPEKLGMPLADIAQVPGYHALFGLEGVWRRKRHFKNRLRLTPRQLDRLIEIVDQLEDELRNRMPACNFLATALFMQIVGYLSRCYGESGASDRRNLPRIAEAISHLESSADTPVSLNELAKVARMSKRSLIRLFRDAMGVTPVAYGIQLRINRAAALLRSGNETITEIAFRCGFDDSNYFSRQFRKVMGVSPRHYRQRHHSSPNHSANGGYLLTTDRV